MDKLWNIMLSERSQAYYMISLKRYVQNRQVHGDRKSIARGWGINGISLWGDENVLKVDHIDDSQFCEYTET